MTTGPARSRTASDAPVWTLRRLGAAVVLALLAQVLVGVANTIWLDVPRSGNAWQTSTPQSLLSAHLILGVAIVVLAGWLAVRAGRGHDRGWTLASAVGIVGILAGFAGGALFMASNGAQAPSFVMTVGCVVAIVGYVLALAREN